MDVFVLAGQSNMQGSGVLRGLEQPDTRVRVFGLDRTWQAAREPLHRLWRSPEAVHRAGFGDDAAAIDAWVDERTETTEAHIGAGLGVSFANAYVAATGRDVGLIPVAYGGSSLADWSPARDDGLYGAMVRAVRAAGVPLTGVLWHQGESETDSDEQAANYVTAMRALVDAMRRDFGQADLPVFIAQIGFFPVAREPGADARWTAVRLAQLDPAPLGVQGVVATGDLALGDPIHLATPGLQRLGRRFARVVTGAAQTIGIGDVSTRDVPTTSEIPRREVRLRMCGITGPLRADGAPVGFSLRTLDGRLIPAVWAVDLDGDCVVVHVAGDPVEGEVLHYGYGSGAEGRGNITDAADMALPCFAVRL